MSKDEERNVAAPFCGEIVRNPVKGEIVVYTEGTGAWQIGSGAPAQFQDIIKRGYQVASVIYAHPRGQYLFLSPPAKEQEQT